MKYILHLQTIWIVINVFMSVFNFCLQNRFQALSTGSRDSVGGLRSNATDNEQTISQIKYCKYTLTVDRIQMHVCTKHSSNVRL